MIGDTKVAAMNFLNALERIPKLVEQYKAQNVTYERNIPLLQETIGGTWKKENELKALKAEVATLERKIQLTLAPPRQAEQNAGEQMQTDSKPDISPKPNAPNNAEGGIITDKDTERFMREHVVFAHIQPSVENQRSKGIKV